MKHLLPLLICLVTSAVATAQAPVVTRSMPTRNQLNVARSSVVAVGFDQLLSTAAPTLTGVKISSPLTGRLHGAATLNDSTLTLQPSAPLMPGEVVTVSVTTQVRNRSNLPLFSPRVYQFTAAAASAPATFTGSLTLNFTDFVNEIEPADLDGDGDLDVVSSRFTGSTGSALLSINLSNGNGTFGTATAPPVSNVTEVFKTVDVDNDGDLDLVATGAPGTANSGKLVVQLNNGSGTFTATQSYPVGLSASKLTVGDVNGDGYNDVVLVVASSGFSVAVLLNNGSGGFAVASTLPQTASVYQPGLGDVDNDGDLDMVVLGSNSTVRLYRNDGTGSFGSASTITTTDSGSKHVLADVDADGDLDLLFNSGYSVFVYRNNGTGNFALGSSFAVTSGTFGAMGLATGDIDGDGDLDVVAASGASNGVVHVRFNNGLGMFSGNYDPVVSRSFATPGDVALVDLDGDQDLDLLVANFNQSGTSVRLNKAGSPTITTLSPTSGPAGTTVTVTGTNLTGTTRLTLNGLPVTGFNVLSQNQITFTVPGGASSGVVNVTTPDGTFSSAQSFQVTPLSAGSLAAAGWELTVFPNPASELLTLHLNVPAALPAPPDVELINSLGQVVARPELLWHSRTAEAQLPVRNLARGLFTLRLRSNSGTLTRRIQLH